MSPAKTILLIDDDCEILGSLQSVLECKGHRVLTAGDGETGMALAGSELPDLVVVDMMMPKKSGFVVIDQLKAHRGAGPKVIMMTANEGSRHRAYAEFLGADDYLRKPFALDHFLATVGRLCPAELEPLVS